MYSSSLATGLMLFKPRSSGKPELFAKVLPSFLGSRIFSLTSLIRVQPNSLKACLQIWRMSEYVQNECVCPDQPFMYAAWIRVDPIDKQIIRIMPQNTNPANISGKSFIVQSPRVRTWLTLLVNKIFSYFFCSITDYNYKNSVRFLKIPRLE
jgi:hypothetical protein